jgi:hypothetical protein
MPRTRSGYVLVKADHPAANSRGLILEHRLVMEEWCGRPLKQRERVHHRDGDRARNDRDNLLLFASQEDHVAYERTVAMGKSLRKPMAPVETCQEPPRRHSVPLTAAARLLRRAA